MTYGQLRAQLTEMAPGVSLNLLDSWTQGCYERIIDELSWERIEQITTLTTVAEYAAGTVALTNGSAAVVGTGTTWTSSMVGRMFRVAGQSEFYTVSAFTDATHITLERNYTGATSTGLGYRINKAVFSFGSDVRMVSGLVSFTGESPVTRTSKENLDLNDPARSSYGQPITWSPSFDAFTTPPEPTIELNPVPTLAQTFKVTLVVEAVALSASSVAILPWVRPECLRNGVMASIRRWQKDYTGASQYEAAFMDGLARLVAVAAEMAGNTDMRMADRFTARRRSFSARRGW